MALRQAQGERLGVASQDVGEMATFLRLVTRGIFLLGLIVAIVFVYNLLVYLYRRRRIR